MKVEGTSEELHALCSTLLAGALSTSEENARRIREFVKLTLNQMDEAAAMDAARKDAP